jgi:hypothetical protein
MRAFHVEGFAQLVAALRSEGLVPVAPGADPTR